MKRVFLDTNVIIDFLADRKPFAGAAAGIFSHAELGNITIFISAVSYNNIYYILRQSVSHVQALRLLDELTQLCEIVEVSGNTIRSALKSGFKDFEDAIQYHCAVSVDRIDAIVTRDTKDFKKSSLPVMNPNEALTLILSD